MNRSLATPFPKRQISQEEFVRSDVRTAVLLKIQTLCYNGDISKDPNQWRTEGGTGVHPLPPEVPKFWQSRTGLQIEWKMFSDPIPTS